MAEEKKSTFQKIKEKFDDKEEQFEYISVAVRLLVVFWSGLLVTSNYLPKIPGYNRRKAGYYISSFSVSNST
jgi:hypothetical protein